MKTLERQIIEKQDEKIKILEFLRYWGDGFSKNLQDSHKVKIEKRKRLNELESEITGLEKEIESE